MNYFGKFDATVSDALGQHPSARLFSESVHAAKVPADAVVVSDAQLLFNAEFKRAGVDLVLSGDGREVVLHDYFKGEHRAPIASPDGAHLTGDIVTALAGEVQVAQADGSAGAHTVIGHVTKLVGSATAIRNGVSIILNNGDNVEKGDVVASGSDSTVGITFIDGTVFGLSSNARMVLNEMVYDPNGSNNSSLLSLVAGTITFVAGETAKHGDMKVDTPVATMGIRGTAVLVEIDFAVPAQNAQPGAPVLPDAKFQVLVEPDGTTGSYILFDKQTLTPLAVVDQAGMQINISNGILSQTLAPLSPEIQKLITDVFSLKFSDSSNTKSIEHFTDTIVPTDAFGPIKFAGLTPNLPVVVTITTLNTDTSNSPSVPPILPPHFHGQLHIATTSGTIIQRAGVTGTGQDTVSGAINFVDRNPFDHPTVSTQFSSFSLHNAQGQDISGTLTAQQLSAVEAALVLTANPGNNNNGVDTWTYSVPASALSFLTTGETLTLTYNATVNNNFGPDDETVTAPITITIKTSGEIWSETHEIASPAPGDWYNGANWQSGAAPGPTDDVIIVTDPTKSGTPFYAVTIKDGGAPASADSVTMNDLGETPPELDNYNTGNSESGIAGLSIGSGGLHMNADSILKNFGTISIGGIAEILQHSVLQNSGPMAHLTLEQGGDFADSSSITNSGTIELAGGTLNVDVDIANKGGTIIVDAGIHNILELNGATISDGTLTNDGTVGSTGNSALDNVAITNSGTLGATSGVLTIDPAVSGPSLNNSGAVEADGGELDIAGEPVINTGTLLATADSLLKLTSTTVTNTDGAVIVDPGSTLELVGAKIDNGTLTNDGTVNSTGTSTLFDVGITNHGTLESTSGLLTIAQNVDPTVVNTGTLEANGGELDITSEPVTNTGTLRAIDDSTLKLTSTTVTNTDGKVNVDGGASLDLVGAEIDNGTLTNNGTLNSTGTSTLSDVGITNTGTLQAIDESVLKLTSTTVTNTDGTVNVDGGSTLDLIGAEIDNGHMTIGAGGLIDVESVGGAILDGVMVTGTSGEVPSTIEIGMSGAATLLLEGGTTIANGNLRIAANGTLDIESSGGATLDGVNVTNFGTIQVDGGASGATVTLVLDGGMTISGGKLIIHEPPSPDQGIVEIKHGGATFDDVTVTNNNELIIDATVTLTLTDNTSILGGTIDDAGTLLVSSASEIENATANGGGDVTVTGGTLTLSGVTLDDVTLSGSFTNADTLTIDETVTLHGATLSGGTIEDDGTLAGFGTINSIIAGPGALTASGGTLTLTGDNTYSGVTTIDGGSTLALSGTGSIANSSDVVDDGTFDISKTSAGASIVTLSGNGAVNLGAQTLTLTKGSTTFDGAINGSGGLTVDGSGTETLTGDNTYTGATTIGSGETLALSGAGSIADSSDVVDDGTFDISKTSAGASIGTLSGNGAVNLGAQTLTLTKGSTTFDGAINGSGGLTVDGSGTETLTGDNTYTGATTIGSGETLALSGAGSIANSSDVVDDGTFDISKTSAGASIVTLSGNGAVKLGSKTLSLSNASTTFSGAIGGTGGLTLLAGMLILTGDSNYSGTTTISGTLALSGTGSIADSGNVVDHGTFDISGLTTGGTSIVTLSGDGTVKLGNNTLTLSDASTTFSGTIGGAGGLTLTTGTEILTGNNKYGGTTTINGGTLALSGTGSIASSNGVVDNGSFDISALTAGTSITTLSGTGKVNLGSNTLTLTAGAGTFSGVISGSGGLTVDGTGTETLAGVNTYTGATTIGSGETLALSGSGSIAKSSGVADNGSFDISGLTAGTSITTLSGTGKVNLGSKPLTLTAGAGTFSGVISGSGGLTVDGTGTETLAGVNTYTGATTIGAGETLALSGTGSIAKSSGVADNGTFDISTTTLGASIVTLSGNGALKLGNETLTLTHASTAFDGTISSTGGGITVAGGTLTLGTMTLDDLTLAGSFSNSGTLTVNHTVTLNGATIDGGTLDISGILDSTGTSTISDATIINPGHIDVVSGTLTIDPTPFTNTGTFEVGSSAAFSGEAITDTQGHVISVLQEVVTNTNGKIQIDQGGTLTLFDTTINGGTIIDHGTLLITGTTNKLENVTFSGSAALDISNNTSLELGGSDFSGVTVNFGTPGPKGNVVSTGGLLILDDSHHFSGTIEGLVENSDEGLENHVDLTDLAWHQGQMHVSYNNGEVTVSYRDDHKTIDSVTLNVSGTSGDFEVSSDGHGGTLLDDPATTGTVMIDSNQVLGISATTSATISFTNSNGNTGELLLNDSHDFTGTIAGFAGDGTIANSDLIDIADVNFANVATDKTTYTENADGTGTLTLYNANGQALDSLNFTGSYQLANFTVESDGSGGTLIVDPPVNTSTQTPANTVVASGPNQVLSGAAPADNFVFNFAAVGHSAIANFNPAADMIQFSSSVFANVQSILNAVHDDGHGNSVIAIDAHDSITLNGVSKAQLHANDFHVV